MILEVTYISQQRQVVAKWGKDGVKGIYDLGGRILVEGKTTYIVNNPLHYVKKEQSVKYIPKGSHHQYWGIRRCADKLLAKLSQTQWDNKAYAQYLFNWCYQGHLTEKDLMTMYRKLNSFTTMPKEACLLLSSKQIK